MTFERGDNRPRLVTRVDPETKRKVETIAEENGTSVSQLLREAIAAKIGRPEPPGTRQPPHDEDLRRAWHALLAAASPDGWIRIDDANTQVAQAVQRPKGPTTARILRELCKRGYAKQATGAELDTKYKIFR